MNSKVPELIANYQKQMNELKSVHTKLLQLGPQLAHVREREGEGGRRGREGEGGRGGREEEKARRLIEFLYNTQVHYTLG